MADPAVVVDNTGFGDWQRELIKNDRGRPLDLRENAYLVLKYHPIWKGRVAFDEFAQRALLRSAPDIPGFPEGEWTAQHDLNFGLWCAQILQCWFKSEKTIAQGVSMAAYERRFHPVREWISAKRWDETPRLDGWMSDCLGVPKTPYSICVGRFFFLNLIARVFEPGCICRSVIVLEGKQLRGKSEALRAIAEPWFSDSHLDLSNKDTFLQIQGVLLYEIPEMHAFSKADINLVKQFVSSREDNFRAPYAARSVRVKRQVVIAGSTNEALYLRDWTGNTRIHPVRIDPEGIDPAKLAGMREQLFAEAYVLWKKGERRYPTREQEETLFAPEQEARVIEHPWKAIIEKWLDSADPSFCPLNNDQVTTSEILLNCLKFERSRLIDAHEQTVGRIMHSLAWERRRDSAGARTYRYHRPEVRPK